MPGSDEAIRVLGGNTSGPVFTTKPTDKPAPPYVRGLFLFGPHDGAVRDFVVSTFSRLDMTTDDAVQLTWIDDPRVAGEKFHAFAASIGHGAAANARTWKRYMDAHAEGTAVRTTQEEKSAGLLDVSIEDRPCVVFQTNPPGGERIILRLPRECFADPKRRQAVERLLTDALCEATVMQLAAVPASSKAAGFRGVVTHHVAKLSVALDKITHDIARTGAARGANPLAVVDAAVDDRVYTEAMLENLLGASSPTAVRTLVDNRELPSPCMDERNKKYWRRDLVDPRLADLRAKVNKRRRHAGGNPD